MITESLIAGLILLIIGILGMIMFDSSYIIFIILGCVCVGISTLSEPNPTKQDVLNGKAIYKEAQTIIGNDTIKTYDIIWK